MSWSLVTTRTSRESADTDLTFESDKVQTSPAKDQLGDGPRAQVEYALEKARELAQAPDTVLRGHQLQVSAYGHRADDHPNTSPDTVTVTVAAGAISPDGTRLVATR